MDYRLDAGDKALVEAAGEQSRQNKRTAQTDQNTHEASVASLSPRERAPSGG